MTKDEDSFEEWLEGFVSSPYTGNQLKEIKVCADNVSDNEVNHLVKEVELLRFLLKSLLEYCENLENESLGRATEVKNQNQLFDIVRFMLSSRE